MIELYEAGKVDGGDSGAGKEPKTLFNAPTEDDIEWAKNLADEVQK